MSQHNSSLHMSDRHVLIVGGGIAGCMTAMKLVERGCKVTVVERGEIASQQSGESSWAGAGILFPLLPWMYRDAVNQLTLAGAAMYPAICRMLLDETGIDPEYDQSGMLVLPTFDSAQAAAWCAANQITASTEPAADYPVQSLSPGDALCCRWQGRLGLPIC